MCGIAYGIMYAMRYGRRTTEGHPLVRLINTRGSLTTSGHASQPSAWHLCVCEHIGAGDYMNRIAMRVGYL